MIDLVGDTTYTNGSLGVQMWSGSLVAKVDVTLDDFVVSKLR